MFSIAATLILLSFWVRKKNLKQKRIWSQRLEKLEQKRKYIRTLERDIRVIKVNIQQKKDDIKRLFQLRRDNILLKKDRVLNYLNSKQKEMIVKIEELNIRRELLSEDLSEGLTNFSEVYLTAINDLIYALKPSEKCKSFLCNFNSSRCSEKKFEDLVCKGLERRGYARQLNYWKTTKDRLINYLNSNHNFFHFERQKTVYEKGKAIIPDILIYVNNVPLVIIELKAPSRAQDVFDREATEQIQRYYKSHHSFLKDTLLAIISNGWLWSYSFRPFRRWYPIYNLNQDFTTIFEKHALLIFLKLAKKVVKS